MPTLVDIKYLPVLESREWNSLIPNAMVMDAISACYTLIVGENGRPCPLTESSPRNLTLPSILRPHCKNALEIPGKELQLGYFLSTKMSISCSPIQSLQKSALPVNITVTIC